MTSDQPVILFIACGIFLLIQIPAFYSLHRICMALKKENQLYRRFLEQQYHLETDYLDACREMVRESVRTSTSSQPPTQEPRQPRCRRIPHRGAKATSVK